MEEKDTQEETTSTGGFATTRPSVERTVRVEAASPPSQQVGNVLWLGMWYEDPGAAPVVTPAFPVGSYAATKDLAREHMRQQAIDAGANPNTVAVKLGVFPGS